MPRRCRRTGLNARLSGDRCCRSNFTDVPAQEKGADVCPFFLLGKCRFGNGCRLSHSPPTLEDPEAVDQVNRKDEENEGRPKKKEKKENIKKSKDIKGKGSSKKPRMRTADDVISRVLWDHSVEAADVVVGYVDRFLGVLERPFTEFNWDSDPCNCDFSSELALPRHRIQYFIHKGRRIWDRHTRTDRVFGSTGQGLVPPFGPEEERQEQGTVSQEVEQHHYHIIDQPESPQEQDDRVITPEGVVSDNSLTKQDAENEHLKEGTQRQTSGTGSTPLDQQEAGGESQSSKEEVVNDSDLVVLADQISLSQSEGKSREEGQTEEWKDSWDGDYCPYLIQCSPGPLKQRGGGRPSKRRPTHFITFRANTPSVLSSFQHLQQELTRLIPSSASHWVPAPSLHVTLCLLVLPGPAEVTAAKEMLQRFAYLDRNPPVTVSFPLKLKHFGGKVLYLSPQPQVHLQQLNTGLQEAFREQGWLHRDSFNPRYHLTLAKVKDREGERVFEGVGGLRIGKGVHFGLLPINTLHLCSMGMNVDGFYETLCSVNLR
uniref:C3H1-type domain-containing protein n=1 Tax=Esox lucius TaxID=8010 RepID=A0A3P8YGS2_ESOLU